jgi:hypothetical protein
MSDIKEPSELGKARIEEKLFEMQLSMKRMARRRLELSYELSKLEENEAGTRKVIAELEASLKKL